MVVCCTHQNFSALFDTQTLFMFVQISLNILFQFHDMNLLCGIVGKWYCKNPLQHITILFVIFI